jgi:hypothetical protein
MGPGANGDREHAGAERSAVAEDQARNDSRTPKPCSARPQAGAGQGDPTHVHPVGFSVAIAPRSTSFHALVELRSNELEHDPNGDRENQKDVPPGDPNEPPRRVRAKEPGQRS